MVCFSVKTLGPRPEPLTHWELISDFPCAGRGYGSPGSLLQGRSRGILESPVLQQQ